MFGLSSHVLNCYEISNAFIAEGDKTQEATIHFCVDVHFTVPASMSVHVFLSYAHHVSILMTEPFTIPVVLY